MIVNLIFFRMQSIFVKLHLLKLSFSTGWIVPSLNSREGPGPEVHSARWIHCSVQALAWTVCKACTTLCTILPSVLNALVVQCSVFSGGACTGREINDRSRRPQDTCQVSRGGCTATIQCSVIHIIHILSLSVFMYLFLIFIYSCVCEHNHFSVCQGACILTINCTDLRWIVKYNF